jgi:hypothetical protein
MMETPLLAGPVTVVSAGNVPGVSPAGSPGSIPFKWNPVMETPPTANAPLAAQNAAANPAHQYVADFQNALACSETAKEFPRVYVICGGLVDSPAAIQDERASVKSMRDEVRGRVANHVVANKTEVAATLNYIVAQQKVAAKAAPTERTATAPAQTFPRQTPTLRLAKQAKKIAALSKAWGLCESAARCHSLPQWLNLRQELLQLLNLCDAVSQSAHKPSRDWLDAGIWNEIGQATDARADVGTMELRHAVAPAKPQPGSDAQNQFLNVLGTLAQALENELTQVEVETLGVAWPSVVEQVYTDESQSPEPSGVEPTITESTIARSLEFVQAQLAEDGTQKLLKDSLPIEDRRNQAVSTFVVYRLVVLVLLKRGDSTFDVCAALEAEVHRFKKSSASAPRLLKGQWAEVVAHGVPARTAHACLAEAFNQADLCSKLKTRMHFAITSKACSVLPLNWRNHDYSREIGVPKILDAQEPYISTSTPSASTDYRTAVKARIDAVHSVVDPQFGGAAAWQNTLAIGTLPGNKPNMSGKPPHDCKDLGYLLGHEYRDQVYELFDSASQDIKQILIPMLTVPLRHAWNQNRGWFTPKVSWEKVLWFVRWHSWLDPTFKAAVYDRVHAALQPAALNKY